MSRTLNAGVVVLALAFGIGLHGAAATEPTAAHLAEARQLTQDFMQQLAGELMAAIDQDGPVGAIGVCSTAAPGIAGDLSVARGWSVGRTALKVRNPRNAPSVRERAILMAFLQRHAAGESFKTMESAAVIENGGQAYLHYMKAIPTQALCLTCHGESLDPELLETIRQTYPTDAAVGFQEGELRGAFTFVKPLD